VLLKWSTMDRFQRRFAGFDNATISLTTTVTTMGLQSFS
jgi:hypothetical protein